MELFIEVPGYRHHLSGVREVVAEKVSKMDNFFRGSAVLNAGHRQFFLTPSRFAWKKIKDSYHYYIMWGLLPCFAIMSYANFFYGPSILVPIPEGYIPQEYEYYKSPITRWFVKHYLDTDVQTYHERRMQYQYEIAHLELVKDFKRDVKEKMKAEDDYQAFYYRPVVAKNYRLTRKAEEDRRYIAGNE
ncbi:unnamed protein product [Cyprideis torosa]|uniref:NADH dehydrogenase [ubiquinone] 1 beta subcomplex subunit 5, mitochondrial n=1 Tax=Cyprideis torosa TaxID=163714 RepID=A0A7R8ZG90_9CRUS|nr:unnamed protein product [Cyprideis torosa]CAG0881107.1 unnamed protein product [Cyprideis torosa]